MANTAKIRDDLDTLKDDASKVISDITRLSKKIRDVGTDKSKEVVSDIDAKLRDEMKSLRERLDTMQAQMQEYGKDLDRQVHKHPYSFILGALGAGFLLGKLLPLRSAK